MIKRVSEKVQDVTQSVLTNTESDEIWNEVKDAPLDIFGLPNQVVESYCTPAVVEPTKLYLLLRASAVLPALEAALKSSFGSKFAVTLVDKYTVVAKA